MHLTPENPEQFHTISALVLTFLLVVLTLIGADWLNGYKRSIIPEDARLKTPQKAFQTFSGIWLIGANLVLLVLTAYPEYTFTETLHTLLIYSPALLAAAAILPALIVGIYHLLKTTRIAVGFLAHIIITPAWFIGKMILKVVNAWSQFMTKTLIKNPAPTNSERAR